MLCCYYSITNDAVNPVSSAIVSPPSPSTKQNDIELFAFTCIFKEDCDKPPNNVVTPLRLPIITESVLINSLPTVNNAEVSPSAIAACN